MHDSTHVVNRSLNLGTNIQLQGSQAHHIQALINNMNLLISCPKVAGRVSHFLTNWEVLTHGSSFAKWASWCKKRGRNPLSGPIADVVNFLADLSSQGYHYQSLNCYRSAISSVHEAVDGISVGSHPAVARLLKGAFHRTPPMPRYSSFWDVGIVINYLKSLGNNEGLTLRQLTLKTVMLLALTRPSQSADLSNLNIQWRSYRSDGVTFRPTHLAKQNRSSKHLPDFFFPCFKDDPILCPVVTVKASEECTKEFRDFQSSTPKTCLFLSWIGKHNPVTSSTIARWLKETMKDAGIDISIFKLHSYVELPALKQLEQVLQLSRY